MFKYQYPLTKNILYNHITNAVLKFSSHKSPDRVHMFVHCQKNCQQVLVHVLAITLLVFVAGKVEDKAVVCLQTWSLIVWREFFMSFVSVFELTISSSFTTILISANMVVQKHIIISQNCNITCIHIVFHVPRGLDGLFFPGLTQAHSISKFWAQPSPNL